MEALADVIKQIQGEISDNSITVNKTVQDAQKHCQRLIEEKIGKKEEDMEEEISGQIQKLNADAKARSDRINKFLHEKEKTMDILRKDTKKRIDAIVKEYNVKIENAQKSVQKSFDKIHEHYALTQGKIENIVEESSNEPQVMMEKVKNEINNTKEIFQKLQDDNLLTLEKMQRIIELHSKETEDCINIVAEKNQKAYKDILRKFKKTIEK